MKSSTPKCYPKIAPTNFHPQIPLNLLTPLLNKQPMNGHRSLLHTQKKKLPSLTQSISSTTAHSTSSTLLVTSTAT